jgi:transcriptional regulator with GAF, ATPase, and Fis domain
MKDSQRNSRIRLLVKHLNNQRKKQAIQIDLLCNDITTAHRDFLDTIRTLTFAGELYESLIGTSDMDSLFCTCACLIKKYITDANLAFFLIQQANFQLYALDYNTNTDDESYRLEQYFTSEVVESVVRTNRPCDIDELLQMGLQVNPVILKNISAITIPIAANGSVAGFVLLYKFSGQRFDKRQIRLLSTIRRGLMRAIRACVASGHPSP